MSTMDAVRKIVAEIAQAPLPDDEDASLLDAGLIDSFGIILLAGHLESAFGIKVSDGEMIPRRFETLAKIAAFVDGRKAV